MRRIWVRHETRATEKRAPIVPADAATLVERGIVVTVEQSPQRAFPIDDYLGAGCSLALAGSWVRAPRDTVIVGLKELPAEPAELVHRHVMFGHAFKEQHGARALLSRFAAGGGALLDLEYLVDDTGRRLAAFGYWAGYVGAAVALLHHNGRLPVPLHPWTRDELDALLHHSSDLPTALVTGALGRSGRGACDALLVAGIEPTRWDLAETRVLDHAALLDHDILINCVLVTKPAPPFLTHDLLRGPHRLATVCDVTVDVTAELNMIPIYDEATTWDRPARRVDTVDLIAIDNLPSLLPVEASLSFSRELTPQLSTVDDGEPWQRCLRTFREVSAAVLAR